MSRLSWLLGLFFSLVGAELEAQLQVFSPKGTLWLMENRLQILGADCPVEALEFSSSDAQVRQEGAELIIRPHRPGLIHLALWCKGGDQAPQQFQFRAWDFSGQTVLRLGGQAGGKITRQALLQQQFLSAEVENLGLDLRLGIQHYRLLVLRGEQVLFQTQGHSARLDENCRQKLQQVQDGDELHIFNVRALHPGNPPFEVELKGLSLKIGP